MKPIQNLLRRLGKLTLLAALISGFHVTTARAASIRLETKVTGYSSAGWILVLPELGGSLGGRVRHDSSRGCWITDRVQRGEPLRVTVTPTTLAERADSRGIFAFYSTTGYGIYESRWVVMPFVWTGTVPTDPGVRDLVVAVRNSSYQWFTKELPVGTRP